jgi:hypothetical protein
MYIVYSPKTLDNDMQPRFFIDVESALRHQRILVKHLGKNTKVYVEEIVTRDIFGGRGFDHNIEDPVGS